MNFYELFLKLILFTNFFINQFCHQYHQTQLHYYFNQGYQQLLIFMTIQDFMMKLKTIHSCYQI